VLHRLGLVDTTQPDRVLPRLWWCPGGELALLPLHAAGRKPTGGMSVPDFVVSSYTPTVRTLLEARERTPAPAQRMLAVGVAKAPGLQPLPGAESEIRRLHERFPEILTSLDGADATNEAVLAAMPSAEVLHFACHGASHPTDPLSSSLMLADGPLTVERILQRDTSPRRLVVLSACQTASDGALVSDEPIHLASALLMAGFQHVVGTLWRVADRTAAQLAERFYAAVTVNGRPDSQLTAYALHEATQALRRQYPDRPYRWMSYIHIGP
jgi:CHAT domain-containing protein